MICEICKDENGGLRIRWQCPLCSHRWNFHASAIEEIGFFIVHHLVAKHDYSAEQICTYDTGLAEAVREYLGPDALVSSLISRVSNTVRGTGVRRSGKNP